MGGPGLSWVSGFIPTLAPRKVEADAAPNTLEVRANEDVANGDMKDEFTRFYKHSFSKAYKALLLMTDDRSWAEEAVAEAFTRAWREWSTFRGHPNKRAWVIRVAKNTHCDRWRRIGKREIRANPPDNQAATSSEELDEDLQDALAKLTPRQRQIVVLRHLDGFSVDEIAETLSVSESTVRVHHSRAMERLRGLLDPGCNTKAPDTKGH